MKTENIINDLRNLEVTINFSNLDENRELFSIKNEKVIGKYKIENPKNVWKDKFVCFRSKVYSFKCKDKIERKNKTKGISKSQSKHFNFKENKKFLDGEEYQRECNNYISFN